MIRLVERPTPSIVDREFATIVDRLTRRGFLAGVGGSAALLGLAACGSSPEAPAPATSRSIETAYGTVVGLAQPVRVVCVDTYTVAALLDVGYTPVGVGDGGADFLLPAHRQAYQGIAKVASADQEVNLEAIAALKPDLILAVDYPYISDLRDKLAAIAPTAIFTWDSSGDWATMAAGATGAVGRAKPESELERRYHDRTAELKTRYAGLLSRTSIDLVTAGGGQAYVWLAGSGVGQVLTEAGVHFGAASTGTAVAADADDRSVGFKAISFERLDALSDAGAIITLAGSDGTPDADSAAMTALPGFARLPAAQARAVASFVNFFPFSYGQALAALDELAALLDRIQKGTRS